MYSMADQISKKSDIQLAVAACYSVKKLRKDVIAGTTYFTIPYNDHPGYPIELESYWKEVCNDFQPDIIHIYGTEYPRALACMNAVASAKYIISIQGLTRVISRYYNSGINSLDIFKNITIRDILRLDTIFLAKKKWAKAGKFENQYFSKSKHADGRTSWDYTHVKYINQDINFHFCNRTLRNPFYNKEKWKISNIHCQSIFLSQAGSPIKGLHKLLEAVHFIKDEFPAVKIRIAGNNIIANQTLYDKIRLSGYGKYIRSLLFKYELFDKVQFLGSLDDEAMVREYLNAHVFICPSSIENSPNSVGEAQIIGTPVIASYVGGTPDMVTHNETGLLYRFEEVEMLAEYIRKVFTNNELANHLSKNGIAVAEKRHDRTINLKRLLDIYNSMLR